MPSQSQIFTDHLHRTVRVEHFPPLRVVSLVPSQTELLFSMGLDDRVVGITKFCVHPAEWFNTKSKVGGTKTLHLEKIAALLPHLIIGNKEENQREQLETLAARFPVWVSDVKNIDDACRLPVDFAYILGTDVAAATHLAQQMRQSLAPNPLVPRRRAAYFIWRKPYMVAGGDTFIHSMMTTIGGFDNVFQHLPRYPTITENDLRWADPEIILLSSEPYPFAQKHVAAFQDICPTAKIVMVDGEMFSWYGSRLLLAGNYIKTLRKQFDDATA